LGKLKPQKLKVIKKQKLFIQQAGKIVMVSLDSYSPTPHGPGDLLIFRTNLSVSLITKIDQESKRIPEEAGKSFSR